MLVNISLAIFGIFASFLCGWYFANRKKSIHNKLAELDAHLECISKLRKSSIELHRRAYTKTFLLLFCLSVGLGAPTLGKYFDPSGLLEGLFSFVQLIAFLMAIVGSFLEFRAYGDISNYQKAVQRIEEKKEKLSKKLLYM